MTGQRAQEAMISHNRRALLKQTLEVARELEEVIETARTLLDRNLVDETKLLLKLARHAGIEKALGGAESHLRDDPLLSEVC